MECKSQCDNVSLSTSLELIDTLWNVNFFERMIFMGKVGELIDTLWNVNIIPPSYFSLVSGINRYIMECKYDGDFKAPRAATRN